MRPLPAACLLALALPAQAQLTQRVSVSSAGAQGGGNSSPSFTALSADGRYVAFTSFAQDLVPGDTNGSGDVFVRDRWTGTTELVSVSSAGVLGNGNSEEPSISADGRYVAFHSNANNLVAGDTNVATDVFVRDRQAGTTTRASVRSDGAQNNGFSLRPAISADGLHVAFENSSTDLVPGDTNAETDVFVHDLATGVTERVSVASDGSQAPDASVHASISGDGQLVVFHSSSAGLVAGDTNGTFDVFVRDRQAGTTTIASVASDGTVGSSFSRWGSITPDGRYVTFTSSASHLVAGDTNGLSDIFVRDRQAGVTTIASLASDGSPANGHSHFSQISADGRIVAFRSAATNLAGAADANVAFDVFARDRTTGTTVLASVSTGGAAGSGASEKAGVSADGRYVSFLSAAGDLVAGDTNGTTDAFVRDLASSGFTGLCSPGQAGVLACPCGNPPSGPGRGCENSAATGGAVLSASGSAYLTSDSLVFATSGQLPTATSILMQGTSAMPAGQAFGQGVRCVGGALKRLYVKPAVGGGIVAPDLPGGDPGVSARSAALGDPIQAGESRWYLVYYRDPTVLGGCPSASSFNATQTGRVDWSL